MSRLKYMEEVKRNSQSSQTACTNVCKQNHLHPQKSAGQRCGINATDISMHSSDTWGVNVLSVPFHPPSWMMICWVIQKNHSASRLPPENPQRACSIPLLPVCKGTRMLLKENEKLRNIPFPCDTCFKPVSVT